MSSDENHPHTSTGNRIISENRLEEDDELFRQINRQRGKEAMLRKIREQEVLQIPSIRDDEQQKTDTLRDWNALDFNLRFIDLLEQLVRNTEVIMKEIKSWGATDGKVFGTRFIVPQNYQYIHIDFTDSANNENVPNNLIIDVPMKLAKKVTIYNEGPGILMFSTNTNYDAHTKTGATIVPGLNYKLDTRKRRLEVLNIKSVNKDTYVNIIAES